MTVYISVAGYCLLFGLFLTLATRGTFWLHRVYGTKQDAWPPMRVLRSTACSRQFSGWGHECL